MPDGNDMPFLYVETFAILRGALKLWNVAGGPV
jgi:hypothetical protein